MNPSKRTLVILVLALALILTGVNAALAAVWTGQSDYEPGSQVTIHGDNSDGDGYLAGELVFVEVWGPNGFHISGEPNNPTADANGAWSWQFTLWNNENAVGEYRYTATGRTSSVSQSGTFTDETWRYRILDASLGPSTGVCNSTITVRATLQICTSTMLDSRPARPAGGWKPSGYEAAVPAGAADGAISPLRGLALCSQRALAPSGLARQMRLC